MISTLFTGEFNHGGIIITIGGNVNGGFFNIRGG